MSIDRDALIDCLEGLGGADDADVLEAARKAAALVDGSDMEWDEIIAKGIGAKPAAGPRLDLNDDDASVAKALKAMLSRDGIAESTAEDLRDFQADLEKGELEADDRAYILKLYDRLS